MMMLARRVLSYAVLCGVVGGISVMDHPFWIQLAIGIAIVAILALAWDILARTGQVSLGTAAFFGLGPYTTTLIEPIAGMTAAWLAIDVVCAAAAGLLGLLTLRLRRMYFAIATLGFSLSLQVVVLIFPDQTGGAGGTAPPLLAGGDPQLQLLLLGALLLGAMVVSDILLTRRFRPAFFMIRTMPELAAASGVPVVRAKLLAFMVSGVIAGLAGACYGGLYGYVVPSDVFTTNWSVLPLAVAILGGVDTTLGPVLGAVLLKMVEEGARSLIGGAGYQAVYGAVIILFVVAMPQGLAGVVARVARPRTALKRATPAVQA
jgi:branched-chain amino acid transport system permease protein